MITHALVYAPSPSQAGMYTVAMNASGEFSIISRFRTMAKRGRGVVVGLGDDAAVLDPASLCPGQLLAMDMMVLSIYSTRFPWVRD